MVTRLMLLAAVLLFSSGCATYQTRYVYDDGNYADSVAYADRDGSRYSPAHSGYGDYYVGRRDYRYVDSYYYPAYLQWPAYHSLFWGFNRWYHDPFFYPDYYYGVTYFPRNYLSFSARRGMFAFGVGHRYFPYSPYRYAWHDSYYDWSFWHHHYASHRHHPRNPRYGSARNEAERLAWRARTSDNRVLRQAASDSTRLNERGRADYGNRVQAREVQVRDEARGRAARNQSRQSLRSGENLQQRERGVSAPNRVIRPSNERSVDRSRALAQPAVRERQPASELRAEQQRAAREQRIHREPPVASRAAANRGEARAPHIRDSQAAPQVRQVQLQRAYAGREDYERAPSQRPARAQQDYRRSTSVAPASASSAYTRQSSRPEVSQQHQLPPARTAPQSYQQPPRGQMQQTRAYSAPQQAPQQSRQPARAERSASVTRSEAREASRNPREDR